MATVEVSTLKPLPLEKIFKPQAPRFYLPQLDGLRFLAFLLVFLHHFPSAAHCFRKNSICVVIMGKLQTFGWMGVDIFLALSAFLLTSLLIVEYQQTKTLSVKHFYIRRVLRIWPLYYLMVVLGFFIFPVFQMLSPAFGSASYLELIKHHLLPYTFFLGNFSYISNVPSIPIVALWTISLEEQFYLVWPLLLLFLLPLSQRKKFFVLASITTFSFLVRCCITAYHLPFPTIWVFTLARLDPFALGAMLSFIYCQPVLKPRAMLACLLAIILFSLIMHSTPLGQVNSYWQLLASAVASICLIYACLYSLFLKKIFSNRAMIYLGKISFGLYVFHFFIIMLMSKKSIQLISQYISPAHHPFVIWLLALGWTLSLTIVCATVTYHYFEKRFLSLKHRFVHIPSRPL